MSYTEIYNKSVCNQRQMLNFQNPTAEEHEEALEAVADYVLAEQSRKRAREYGIRELERTIQAQENYIEMVEAKPSTWAGKAGHVTFQKKRLAELKAGLDASKQEFRS